MIGGSQLIEFITTVWGDSPPDGFLTIGKFKNKKPKGFHFLRPDDAFGIRDFVSTNKDNFDIYYEIGLQKELIKNQFIRGKEENVSAIPGLWIDIDIVLGDHQKQNLPLDLDSAKELLSKFPLQPSMIVFSGGGIHAYWLFKEPLIILHSDDRNHVKKLSEKFQKTIIQYGKEDGYHVDKTSSLNHLLRLPGTLNHKKARVETYILDKNEYRYNPDDFEEFLVDYSYSSDISINETSSPNLIDTTKTSNVIDNRTKLETLIEKCGFLDHCKKDCKDQSEPEWHKMVCLLAHEYGGYDLIHVLSKDYEKYDEAETDNKIKAAIKNSPAPIRCDTLKGLWDCGRDCGVTSPIHLLNDIVKEMAGNTSGQQIQLSKQIDDESDDYTEIDVLKDRFPDKPFPWKSLPPELSHCIQDLAQDMAVSSEMCGVIALAVLSAAVGNSVEHVEAKKDYKTTVNLWLSVIAESGDKKSPILHRLLKPVLDLQHNAITAFQQQQQNPQQSGNALAVQSNQKPPSIYTTDTTLEGLIELLNDNTRGVLLFQDEISGFLLSFDRYRAGKGGDKEAYLNLWNSYPIKVDRVTKNLYIHRPFLSLLGGMQPKKAVAVFGDKSFEEGLAPRFLFYNHEASFIPLTNHTWSTFNHQLWSDLVKNLYKVPENSYQLTLDDRGWEYFRGYTNALEEMRPHLPDRFKVFIPKAITYALRISGLLHVVDCTIRKYQPPNTISLSTVQNAIKLVNFFLCHSRKMVEHYVSKRPALTQDQKCIIKSILDVYIKRNSLTLPVSEIHAAFNVSVTSSAQIKSDKVFGKFIRKVLKDLKINYSEKRKKVDRIKNPVMCLEFDNTAINNLKSKI